MNTPLISCICVTRDKPHFLRRAIECFNAQSYEHKELLVLFESDDKRTKTFLENYLVPDTVKLIEVEKSAIVTLGYLRNYAVQLAEGEFVCQWDDDDWHHAKRLERQYKFIKNGEKPGCIMSRWIVFDGVVMKSYVSNDRLWEGSILCSREVLMGHPYKDVSRGEDTDMIYDLYDKGFLARLLDNVNLYIYVYHGANSWDRAHWESIFKASIPIDESANRIVKNVLQQKYSVQESSVILDTILIDHNITTAFPAGYTSKSDSQYERN